ncbi:MAG: endolytic transglycosylase MltG [Candidatus Cryptobacteroides sp.]
MKKKILKAVIIVLSLFAAGACVVAYLYWSDNVKPNFSSEYVLYVYPDMTVGQALDSISKGAGVLRPGSLQRCAAREKLADRMKPGKYVIKPSFTSIYTVRMINCGWQTPQNLTISGTIRNKGRLAKKISNQMMVDSASVAQALADSSLLAGYGFTVENVFAMILPDTYEIMWTASVKEIFDRLKREYDAFWTDERLAKAQAQKLDRMEVSVMASIVSGETLKKFEYPKIAAVYLNRYHKGMKLQADPTVCFCYDYKLDRVLKKHLQVDSPYNTYKYAGLPPAPINVPPKACIDAVLNPDSHDYLFFCASPDFDGTHRFAATYSEHLRNARAFQSALTRRLREKNAG